ncbi:MAG: lamin tail domain-containing protein [Sphingobacteriales bacterium]|nr:lamin tail domain-containing protein [Sphingobacteriales bacterium]
MSKVYLFLFFSLFLISSKATVLSEHFDTTAFSKGTYDVLPAGSGTEDNIILSSGSWRCYEGIRGNTVGSDRFNGTQSVRVRGSGAGAMRAVLEMNFDKLNGAGVVEVYAAKYGGDATSYFHFEASTDGGSTWPNSSSTFTVSSTTLTSFTWTANLSGSVRVKIIKETNNNRCNFDDFSITDYSTGTASEIQLQQPAGSDSACGFTYDFGTQIIGTNTDVSIRIKNLGTGSLTIASTPITGTNASEFSVFSAPSSPVPVGDSTDMVIRFSSGLPGTKTAVLTINSDDTDESACIVYLTGTANYASCTELILSEYGEPVAGNGKYVEIYNGTSGSVNLADYQLQKISNGGNWPGSTLTLSGTLAPNTTYLIANNSTDVPGANLYDATFCNWNGNDAVGLAKYIGTSWVLTDAVGDTATLPNGSGWSVAGISNATVNHTLVRKSSVSIPNTDWNSSAGSTSANAEWIVRPYSLSNVSCNVSSCYTSTSIGFTVATDIVNESNTTVTVSVTMNSAPVTTVNALITDALLGTAAAGTDYSITPVTLTFLPAEIYPNTKTVTITIFDDALSESNENVVLDVDAQCGALLSNNRYSLTIVDNEIPNGVVINEFSQGSASKEYLELVVIGTPATTADLRGWIIDDNSGIFSGGYGTQLGIAPGHVKFSNACTWEKVPVGSIILLYNASDKNTTITLPDDPTDADLDYVYVIGIETSGSTCAAMPTSNLYFSSDCVKPNNTSYDIYTPPVYTNVDWNAMQFRNAGDALQIRSPAGGFFHGLSYGSKGSGSDCAGCAINQPNHPDYSVYGMNALYFSGGSNVTYANNNLTDNDYRKLSNWSKTTSASPNALETPGTFNDASTNKNWILSLRGDFAAVLDDQSYTCNLRGLESRYYLDDSDKIIFYIKNNITTDHGPLTAQTILHNTALTGKGFQNSFLTGTPLFMQKTFAATPDTATPADYKIRFYVSTQELQDYCDYINPILDSIPGYYTSHHHTPGEIIFHLKIYRTSTTDRAWTVTADGQVQIVTPIIGTYGPYTTFEFDGFTGFSGYALGDIVTPDIGLPVELTHFNAVCNDDAVTINWTTASEKNSAYFEVERSSDAIHFTSLTRIQAANKSNQVTHYQYTDEYPLRGINYYRLKQQDIGNVSAVYSNIIQTECTATNTATQVFYNSETGIMVCLNSGSTKDMLFNLYEISGRLIYSETKTMNSGYTAIPLTMPNKLADGIYVVRIINGAQITSIKILVH